MTVDLRDLVLRETLLTSVCSSRGGVVVFCARDRVALVGGVVLSAGATRAAVFGARFGGIGGVIVVQRTYAIAIERVVNGYTVAVVICDSFEGGLW